MSKELQYQIGVALIIIAAAVGIDLIWQDYYPVGLAETFYLTIITLAAAGLVTTLIIIRFLGNFTKLAATIPIANNIALIIIITFLFLILWLIAGMISVLLLTHLPIAIAVLATALYLTKP